MLSLAVLLPISMTWGEYGDVILNTLAESEDVSPVIFPHWFHRIRFRCSVCHVELEFEMKAGATEITMASVSDGRFCGACHDGEIAWDAANCDLCHSGRAGLETGIRGGHQTLGPGIW